MYTNPDKMTVRQKLFSGGHLATSTFDTHSRRQKKNIMVLKTLIVFLIVLLFWRECLWRNRYHHLKDDTMITMKFTERAQRKYDECVAREYDNVLLYERCQDLWQQWSC